MSDEKRDGSPRTYRKRKRAAEELRTRARITEATVALHESMGPGHTTVKAIAERAGVQRATVYRHFPDEQALFNACTAKYYASHPMPDPGGWARITSPDERLVQALGQLYSWYAETEKMLFNSLRDIERVPAATRDSFLGYFDVVHGALMADRHESGRALTRSAAAIGHAISFSTWRSLVREQGLEADEAVALMVAMVDAAGRLTSARLPARGR
ncbi:MAG: TetR/AcrR family transcriptional regulator [Solirubrobacterales bacterium]|jgi:AcrR family transcriptional regulator|nr:TetR/AcrR family transcriptional regulator [Solirubrobacterales bacterium]